MFEERQVVEYAKGHTFTVGNRPLKECLPCAANVELLIKMDAKIPHIGYRPTALPVEVSTSECNPQEFCLAMV